MRLLSFTNARGIGQVAEVFARVCSGGLEGLGTGTGRSEAMDQKMSRRAEQMRKVVS